MTSWMNFSEFQKRFLAQTRTFSILVCLVSNLAIPALALASVDNRSLFVEGQELSSSLKNFENNFMTFIEKATSEVLSTDSYFFLKDRVTQAAQERNDYASELYWLSHQTSKMGHSIQTSALVHHFKNSFVTLENLLSFDADQMWELVFSDLSDTVDGRKMNLPFVYRAVVSPQTANVSKINTLRSYSFLFFCATPTGEIEYNCRLAWLNSTVAP